MPVPLFEAGMMNRRASTDCEKAIPERKFCAYTHRVCQQPRIAGKKYCFRHILEDRDSVFRQCQYVHPSSQRRCRYPASKVERREYLCKIHMNKSKKANKRPMTLNETPHKILEQLEIYCQKPEHNAQMATSSRATLKFFDPDSDHEAPLIENCYIYDGDSDAESVDDESTDLKKHAGVYTAEEVAKITKEKMQRLQQLYFEQFQRLKQIYEQRKQEYTYKKRQDNITVGTNFANPREERMYRRYLSYKNYNTPHGTEALLQYKMRAKRAQQSSEAGTSSEYQPPPSCVIEDCDKFALPLTKWCRSHILNDPEQKLFKACGIEGCTEVVFSWETCPEHVSLELDHQKLIMESLPEGVELRDEPKEYFEGMDDIAALGLDAVEPSNLFMLNQSGVSMTADGDESTDSALSDEPRPTDNIFDDDLSNPMPGPSNASQKSFHTPKPSASFASTAATLVGQPETNRSMALQNAPEFILESTD